MTIIHNLGFPRIGAQRELKFGLEAFWRGEASAEQLNILSTWLREQHWQLQSTLDYVPVGDFSLYDQVLDMSFTLGHLPERVQGLPGSELDQYFRVARGRSAGDSTGVAAGEMTKWFDTNYHYIVPEFTAATQFKLNPQRLVQQLTQARAQGVNPKPVIIGPVTYLALGKAKDESNKLALLERLLPVYAQLLDTLAAEGVEWVQVDEPILVTELDADWQHALNTAYHQLKSCKVKILLASYFGPLLDNKYLAANLPVAGLHVDATHDAGDVQQLIGLLPAHKVLSLGVISGRNIWKTDLSATLDWLEPLAERLGERLWLAPSCSLLHVPVDLDSEEKLDPEVKNWLAFAKQKLHELHVLGQALNQGRASLAQRTTTPASARRLLAWPRSRNGLPPRALLWKVQSGEAHSRPTWRPSVTASGSTSNTSDTWCIVCGWLAWCSNTASGSWLMATSTGRPMACSMPVLAPPPPANRSITSSWCRGRTNCGVSMWLPPANQPADSSG